MWDYFVRHLAGLEPPPDFRAKSSSDYLLERVKAFQMAAMAQPETSNSHFDGADNLPSH